MKSINRMVTAFYWFLVLGIAAVCVTGGCLGFIAEGVESIGLYVAAMVSWVVACFLFACAERVQARVNAAEWSREAMYR